MITLHIHPTKKENACTLYPQIHKNFACHFTGLKDSHKPGFLNIAEDISIFPASHFLKTRMIILTITANFKNVF